MWDLTTPPATTPVTSQHTSDMRASRRRGTSRTHRTTEPDNPRAGNPRLWTNARTTTTVWMTTPLAVAE